ARAAAAPPNRASRPPARQGKCRAERIINPVVQYHSTDGRSYYSAEHQHGARCSVLTEPDAREVEPRRHAVRGLVSQVPRELDRAGVDRAREVADAASRGVHDDY